MSADGFYILWVLVKKIKYKVFASFSENPYCNRLQSVVSAFWYSPMALTIFPKAARVLKSVRKAANEMYIFANRKFDAAFGTIFRISKVKTSYYIFFSSKAILNNIHLLT